MWAAFLQRLSENLYLSAVKYGCACRSAILLYTICNNNSMYDIFILTNKESAIVHHNDN